MGPAEAPLLRIEVAYSPGPGQVEVVPLRLPQGTRLLQAVVASGLCERHALDADQLRTGLWGRPQPADALLRDQDRVEIYRPLKVDPKEARRLRYKRTRTAPKDTPGPPKSS
jgi:putative ubiquitin-RnfH superfamily antitoxin RatB of RatAB toxin-antitoxin module